MALETYYSSKYINITAIIQYGDMRTGVLNFHVVKSLILKLVGFPVYSNHTG